MKTYFSVTYDENQATGNGKEICIANKLKSIKAVREHCKGHADNARNDFSTTMHHYQVTEWDEDDNILNQMNLEEVLYAGRTKSIL